jgi:hypothetical protein
MFTGFYFVLASEHWKEMRSGSAKNLSEVVAWPLFSVAFKNET